MRSCTSQDDFRMKRGLVSSCIDLFVSFGKIAAMELEQRISNWLPALDKEIVELTVQKLQQCGVESLEHLKYVVEEDLQFLKPISRRILLERFHSAATPNPPVSLSPNDIQSPTSTQCASFSTPWEVFPPQLMKACQEGKRPVKSDLNEMVRLVSDHILAINRKPGRKILRAIAAEIVSHYLKTFEDTLNGAVIGSGIETLLWKLENCVNNKRRPSSEQPHQFEPDDELDLSVKRVKIQRDSYGCVAWQPKVPSDETADSQEKKKDDLLSQFRLAFPDETMVAQLMSETYASQRQLINASKNIRDIERSWPFLFQAKHLTNHVNILLGSNVAKTFDDRLKTVGRQVFRYAHSQVKKECVKSCLQEIEAAKTNRKSMAVEYEAMPLLLLAIFGEDKELFYKLTEEMASDDDLGDLPSCPFICVKGWTSLTANSYTICVDTHPVLHASKPDEAFKLLFFAHFAFNIQYQKETSLCLEFTQRAIAGINPARGTKVQKNGGKQHCQSPRVAALVTALKDYDF
ncbi:uncharacterized protein LOC144110662 [Amblyomma americanum]